MKRILYGLCIVLAGATATAADPLPLSAFPKSTLQIATPDARVHRFNIWVADEEPLREQGLMFVKDLPADAGMLFIYSQSHRIVMWMKNTLIPLDMVFIRADGRVAGVVANAKPLSLDNIESCAPPPHVEKLPPEQQAHCSNPKDEVIAVLELNGGTAASLNIRKGAIVMHRVFGQPTQ
jgi:uncharacterized membrane protein (UPF0127 family)